MTLLCSMRVPVQQNIKITKFAKTCLLAKCSNENSHMP